MKQGWTDEKSRVLQIPEEIAEQPNLTSRSTSTQTQLPQVYTTIVEQILYYWQ